jgi:hypothetical protein
VTGRYLFADFGFDLGRADDERVEALAPCPSATLRYGSEGFQHVPTFSTDCALRLLMLVGLETKHLATI